EQYRPIPNGGRKALALIAAIPISAAIAYVITRIWCGANAPTGIRVLGACAAVLAVFAILDGTLRYSLGNQRLLAWCREYRRRNVLGYTGMFWFRDGKLRFHPYENEKGWDGWTPKADGQRALGPCPKCPRWCDEHRERYDHPYAMLSLGGWRSSYENPYGQNGAVYVSGHLCNRGIRWRIGFVGLSTDGSDLLVSVTDPTGTTIQCALREAFTILTVADQLTPKVGLADFFGALIAGAMGLGQKPVTIGDVIAFMGDDLRKTMTKLDAAQQESAQLRKDAEEQERAHRELKRHDAHLLDLATRAIEAIDASKRYVRSLEGLRVKQMLLRDLLELLPTDHYMRSRFTEMLAAANATLADHDRAKAARKQGASPSSPT
ncbi:hypothetical protein HY634_04515, partial [Candidatus Uhrbacteria bacterium]|nr:hypothetical protein [Candidatus Uhrbacteria bacterium]